MSANNCKMAWQSKMCFEKRFNANTAAQSLIATVEKFIKVKA